MVYKINYQAKRDAADPNSKWRDSFFVESKSKPEVDAVRKFVEEFSGGDFAEETIEIEEFPDCDGKKFPKGRGFYKLD